MKLGTYTKLSSQLLGLALIWSSTACGIRSTLLQEEDAGAVTEDEGAQSSSTSSGGRSGTSSTPRAGRSGSGAAGTGGAGQATAGRAARAGRGGSSERAGTGGAGDQGAAAGSGDDKKDDEKKDEQQAGSGGEKAEQAGSGGENAEQAGAGGEQAGAGGQMSEVAGMDAAAGSGGAAGEPAGQAGTGGAPARVPGSLSQLTPEEVTALCSNIDMATASLPWGDGIRGYCARRGIAQPAMCAAVRDMCVSGPEITPVCAQTIPDCPNITITEYQRCRIDTLYRFVEDNRTITCETMPPLPEPQAIPSCDVIYDRCPAARALRVL